MVLFRSEDHAGRNSQALENVPNPIGSISVSSTTIDRLVMQFRSQGLVLLKIDIEGSELQALRGAQSTLTLDCAVMLEYWPAGIRALGGDPHQLLSLVGSLNYNSYLLDEGIGAVKYISLAELRDLPTIVS